MDIMNMETINLKEMGKDEGLATYEKVWEASDLAQSINIPHYFWVGLFLEAIIRTQEKAVDLLGILCGEVLVNWKWAEESINFYKPVSCVH